MAWLVIERNGRGGEEVGIFWSDQIPLSVKMKQKWQLPVRWLEVADEAAMAEADRIRNPVKDKRLDMGTTFVVENYRL